MPRLVSPLGVVVSVSDEKAQRLGWRPVEADQPAVTPAPPTKRRRGKKSEQD